MKRIVKPKVVVNNIIDPDKLAEAMLKAELIKKEQEEYSTSKEWMKYIATTVLWLVAVASALFGIAMFVVCAKEADKVFSELIPIKLVSFLIEMVIALFFLGLGMLSGATARELDKEKDKNYIATMFSNVISLIALAVAFVALFKGVG